MPELSMLTALETWVYMGSSTLLFVLLMTGPFFVGIVFWRRFRRRDPFRHLKHLEGMSLNPLGEFNFSVDHQDCRVTATRANGSLPGSLRLVLGNGMAPDEGLGCPRLDAVCRVEGIDATTLKNLSADCRRLKPLEDLIYGWAGELEKVAIGPKEAIFEFRYKSGQRGYLPGKKLPDFLRHAAACLKAVHRAGEKPPVDPTTESPEWKRYLHWLRFLVLRNWFWFLTVSMGFTVVVSGAAIAYLTSVGQDRLSMTWPSAGGRVVSSRVKHSTTTSGTGASRSTTHHYEAIIKYEYTVDGSKYTNDRYSFFGSDAKGKSHSRRLVDKHPRGKRVKVFYNPQKPRDSVLHRRGESPKSLDQVLMAGGLTLGLLGLLIGLSSVFISWSHRRSLQQTRL